MAEEAETTLAERLDEAARAAGKTNEELAESLGVTAGNVGHWRRGRHRPDVEMVLQFAREVGASDYYLLTGKSDPGDLARAFQVARARLAEAVARGEDPAQAWEEILGQAELFSPQERQRLAAGGRELERFLVSLDGDEWVELTGEQHRVLRELVRLFSREARRARPRKGRGQPPPP